MSPSATPENYTNLTDVTRLGGSEMALDVERVVNGGVNGQEALG
jgi:hypothetical protein